MMEPFERIDIQELPLSSPFFRRKVEVFLGSNGLRLEELDLYMAILDPEGRILAGGGLHRDVLKCIAVSESARSAGCSVPLISRLVATAAERGYTNLKVFTKPENRVVFESLGFRVLAEAPKAVLMENGRGLDSYCSYLRSFRRNGRCGVVVLNANPFTLGHQYLVTKALEQVDTLYVIPVRENASRFSYEERLDMIRTGTARFGDRVIVLEGSAYCISAATFPTYFLKDLSDASETQIRLDLDLFGRHLAPALGATVRFVGTEPSDPLTARYNRLMKECLPGYGLGLREIPRLKGDSGRFVKATLVRSYLDQGSFSKAAVLTPASTHPYLLSALAERALLEELDAPLKPGLVGPDSTGAHTDMDYPLMRRSIASLRPYFPKMAMAGSPDGLRLLGIEAEKAMLEATQGVNTHRGAIFALGLALYAAGRGMKLTLQDQMSQTARAICEVTRKQHPTASTHGSEAVRKYGVKGAREMALDGYKDLFSCWQPYYHRIRKQPYALQRTLVCLIAALDDTCLIHRVGFERAEALRGEASAVFGEIARSEDAVRTKQRLEILCGHYAAENASPGGAADMLSLTLFIDSILS